MSNLSGFKQFVIKEEEGPEPENKIDYFSALGDEEGIEWSDLVKAYESDPQISAHFGLGQNIYKLSPWEIVKGSLTPNGADIRLKPQRGNRSYLKGNRLNKSNYEDNRRYHLNRKELLNFLTKGWTPIVQPAGGDMGGGMGDMGGGMGAIT